MQFKRIVGVLEEKKHLVHSVQEGRISHAQLFLSEDGGLAFPMAMAYASYILCQNKNSEDSCGTCPSCLKIAANNHPDLHFSFPVHLSQEVRTSDNMMTEWREQLKESIYFNLNHWNKKQGQENKQGIIGKDESVRIVKRISLKAFEGGYKIMIIWMPELMNKEASNRLLKTIEEPPSKTIFIIVAADLEKIIPTILSRTQIIKIAKPKETEIFDFLTSEKGIEAAEATIITQLSERNLAKAIQLIQEQTEANFNFENFVNWMRLCYQRNIVKTIDWVDEIAAAGRENQKNFILFCLHMFRQCIIGHYSKNDLVVLSKDQIEFLTKFSPFINHMNIAELTETLDEAYYHIERNANPKILFLDVSIKIFTLLNRK